VININNKIHKKGPGIDPWPGPNNGVMEEFSYVVEEIPY
jgi:hypothetical protein